MTYQELATKIGRPRSFRAVASACGKNPYVPEIPCHRVVRKDGGLGGYSAKGGIARKKKYVTKRRTQIFQRQNNFLNLSYMI